MPNMSYCRMQNTSRDLRDCLDNWDASYSEYGDAYDLSEDEQEAKKRIIKLCVEILDTEGYTVEE